MDEPILAGEVEREPDGSLRVLSPGVGWWSELPRAGALLGPGSTIGRLRRLNRSHRLVLPPGTSGQVTDGLPHRRVVPVEYGQPLFRLVPVADATLRAAEDGARSGQAGGADIPAGTVAVVSPTDGVFYRSPAPDAPPFVEVGQRIQAGQAVGLVEVMKTFNQISYGGPGLPEQAQVVEIRVGNAQEVLAGDVLIVLR